MSTDPFADLLDEFLLESRERIDNVEESLLDLRAAEDEAKARLIEEAKRELHTLKGNAAMMGLKELQTHAHGLEDQVEALDLDAPEIQNILPILDHLRTQLETLGGKSKGRPVGEEAETAAAEPEMATESITESVRVPFPVLDALVDQLAEMVIFRNRLSDALDGLGKTAAGHDEIIQSWNEAKSAQETLNKTLDLIQDGVMGMRMVPLKSLFRHLRRIIYDETAKLGKEVDFEATGGDTPMDKVLLEVASEALGHLIRNAIAHGIETPEERERHQKPRTGTVRLTARARSNEVEIDVEDDGGGIDREALAEAARQQGVEVPEEAEVYSLVFAAGISTREKADLSAGRGIGLFAVFDTVQRHGGRVDVQSTRGVGSRFRLRLPLSVSITRALLVKVDGEEYALPISAIAETLRFDRGDTHELSQSHVFRWRHNVIPVLDLGSCFGTSAQIRDQGYVIVVGADGRYRGLVVDEITGSLEIVVKGLDPVVGSPPGISGSTILGDGRVILILDPSALMETAPSVGSTA